jgi:hypothetical protein
VSKLTTDTTLALLGNWSFDLSIALAGLFGDNMVDKKMNFVVGCRAYYRDPLYIFYQTINKGDSETTYALSYSRLSLLK